MASTLELGPLHVSSELCQARWGGYHPQPGSDPRLIIIILIITITIIVVITLLLC